MTLTTLSGAPLRLGPELARGGEGTIFDIPDRPELVAKIYHAPLSAERGLKLRAMAGASGLAAVAAWPMDVVLRDGRAAGLVMPRLRQRHDFDALLSAAARRRAFPSADYRMLVAVAANLARAMASVHAAGHVIGDVNERCAMVAADGTVRLIDCDSFQIEAGGTLFPCDVGTPMYQPPEMQDGDPFRARHRSRNHDAFGLAVLIFRLLFFGRHPFAGRPASGEAPELPEAIRANLFAWSGQLALRQPPNTLALADLGPGVESYFRRAFGPEGANAGRPRASAWAEALDRLQQALQPCAARPAHWHLGLKCPICTIEDASGVSFFVDPHAEPPERRPEAEAGALWAAVNAVPRPLVRTAVPDPASLRAGLVGTPYPAVTQTGWLAGLLQTIGLLSRHHPDRPRRERALAVARQRYDGLVRTWRSHDPGIAFANRLALLTSSYDTVALRVRQREAAVASARSRLMLQAFLGGFAVQEAGLRGFGEALLLTLTAHGIESAADLTPAALAIVPGIGPKRRAALMEWRNTVATDFRPGAAPPLPRTALRPVEARFDADIRALLAGLRAGAEALWKLREQEDERTRLAWKALGAAAQAVAQAEADVAAALANESRT